MWLPTLNRPEHWELLWRLERNCTLIFKRPMCNHLSFNEGVVSLIKECYILRNNYPGAITLKRHMYDELACEIFKHAPITTAVYTLVQTPTHCADACCKTQDRVVCSPHGREADN